jgi:membrane-associated phospholipid phosphatase
VNAVDELFRDKFLAPNTSIAGVAGNVNTWGLAPLLLGGLLWGAEKHEDKTKNFWVDALVVAEASMTAVSLSEIVKGLTLRERPNVHALVDETRHAEAAAESGSNLSFPAGHTLSIMAITSSAATVAGMRRYRATPVIWIVGTTLALASGYFRIAGDQHYFTDTLGGAAMGLGIGAAVPLLFHGPRTTLPPAMVSGDGRSVTVTIGF